MSNFKALTLCKCETMVRPNLAGHRNRFLPFIVLESMMKKPGKTPVDDRIQNFEKRLDESVAAQSGSPKVDTTGSSAAGLALRIISELFVGVAVCMFGGYYLDRYFGTTPWLMIGLMPVGLAAGVLNVMRLSNTKQAKEVMGEGMPIAPSLKDDDED